MAESLLFRKGSLAGLEQATKVAGAISFTTDEPAIYLDVQEGESIVRKRIGDLIVYNTAEELIAEGNTAVNGTVGSWSKTALYYVVEDNALLKWNGSTWTQINSVSDVEAEFNELNKIVSGDPAVQGDTGLVGRVSTLENEMDAAQADIEALETAVGSVPTNSNLYDLLQAEIERSTDKDEAHDASIEDHETRIGALETTVGDSNSGLVKDVADNKAAIQANANDIDAINNAESGILAQAKADATTKANAAQSAAEATAAADATSKANQALADAKTYTDGEIDKVEATLQGLSNADDELNTAVEKAQKAADDITAVVGKSTDEGDSSLYGKVNAEIARSSGIDEDHEQRIDDLEAAIGNASSGLSQQVAANTQAITALQNQDTALDGKISANITAIGNEETRAKGEEARIEGLVTAEVTRAKAAEEANTTAITNEVARAKAAEEANTTAITELGNTVTGNKTAQDQVNAAIRKEFADADKELKEYIDTNMATADAMKYKGVITDGVLPTTADGAIEGGWTYKVSGNFVAPTSNVIETEEAVILTGDLLIASSDLAQGDEIPENFWHHVSSGYEDDKDPVLVGAEVAADGENTAGVEVALKSHLGDDRGSVAIVGSTKSNVRVASVTTVDDGQTGDTSTVITLGLEWGEF